MSPLPSVDLITPCRNRVEYLRDSLPSWLACPQLRRIIIVDFNSSTPVIDALGDLGGKRITVVRVEDEPIWRQGRAQNIGLGMAEADLVLKSDADVPLWTFSPMWKRWQKSPASFSRASASWAHLQASAWCRAGACRLPVDTTTTCRAGGETTSTSIGV